MHITNGGVVDQCNLAHAAASSLWQLSNASGLANRKNINRALGMLFRRFHSDTDGGSISQSRATAAVPPRRSMISEASMSTMIGKPNSKSKVFLTPETIGLPNMASWFIRLAESRISRGLSKAELSRRVGVSGPTLTDWENGKFKPKGENLIKLCRVLDVSPRWLMEGRYEPPLKIAEENIDYNISQGPDVRGLVPIISWVQAGAWHEVEDFEVPGNNTDFLPCPASHGLKSYALRVEGDSMTAMHGKSYPAGSIIFVDPDQAGGVVSGDRVIAKFNGEAKVTFKVYVEEAGMRFLKPLNPQYPAITDEFRIIGKVIGKWEPE